MTTFVLQLASYGLFLVVFLGIAYYSAFRWGIGGMLAGHFVIAALITFLDVTWVQIAMNADGWDGAPDMDLVFMFGLLIRIVLTNTLLLPVIFVALRIRSASREKMRAVES